LVKAERGGSRRRESQTPWFSDRDWVMVRVAFAGVVAAIYYVAAVVGSSWYADDFLYLQLARQGELTPSWLAVDSYGHFAPGTRLAYLFVQRVGGLDYQFAATVPVALSAAAAFALISLLGEISGRRPRTIVLAAAASLSVFVMRVVLWWGAGVHIMGALAGEVLCMWCFVVFLRNRHRRWLLGSWLALVMGLLVQERPLLTIGYLVLLRYVGLSRGPAFRGLARQLWSDLPMWAGYVAITAVYLGYRLFLFPGDPRPGDLRALVDFSVHGIVNNLLPGSLGARVDVPRGYSDLPLVLSGVVLASIVVAVVAFALITWSRRESWRPWGFYAPCLLANLVVFVLGRMGATNDPRSAVFYARDQQYFVEANVLLIVTIAIALSLPPRPAWTRAHPWPRRTARAVVSATGAFLLLSTAVSWNSQIAESGALPSKSYLERAVTDLRHLTDEHPVDLIELTMPVEVNPFYVNGYNDMPGVIGVDAKLRDGLDVTSPHKVAVTASGRVARVAPAELVRLTRAQLAKADLSGGATIDVIDGRPCVTAPAGGGIGVRLAAPVESGALFVSIEYDSARAASVLPVVSDGADLRFNWSPAILPAGDEARVARIRFDRVDALSLVFTEGVDGLCLEGVALLEVALLEPVPVPGAPSGVRCPVLDGSGHVTQRLVRCDGRWR
jgi:hypothetical protein